MEEPVHVARLVNNTHTHTNTNKTHTQVTKPQNIHSYTLTHTHSHAHTHKHTRRYAPYMSKLEAAANTHNARTHKRGVFDAWKIRARQQKQELDVCVDACINASKKKAWDAWRRCVSRVSLSVCLCVCVCVFLHLFSRTYTDPLNLTNKTRTPNTHTNHTCKTALVSCFGTIEVACSR